MNVGHAIQHIKLIKHIKEETDPYGGYWEARKNRIERSDETDVPLWAKQSFREEIKAFVNNKDIFTDKEGLWATLPLEALQIVMAYHSRNEKRYWGSISFIDPRCKYGFGSVRGQNRFRASRDYNPYKNVQIYIETTEWATYEGAWNSSLDLRYDDKGKHPALSYYKRETLRIYGEAPYEKRKVTIMEKQRRAKDALGDVVKEVMNVLQIKKKCIDDEVIQPSLLKYKYCKDEIRSGAQNRLIIAYSEEGLSEKEIKKGINYIIYKTSKGYYKDGKHQKVAKMWRLGKYKPPKSEMRYTPQQNIEDFKKKVGAQHCDF